MERNIIEKELLKLESKFHSMTKPIANVLRLHSSRSTTATASITLAVPRRLRRAPSTQQLVTHMQRTCHWPMAPALRTMSSGITFKSTNGSFPAMQPIVPNSSKQLRSKFFQRIGIVPQTNPVRDAERGDFRDLRHVPRFNQPLRYTYNHRITTEPQEQQPSQRPEQKRVSFEESVTVVPWVALQSTVWVWVFVQHVAKATDNASCVTAALCSQSKHPHEEWILF